jgi:hypothetical protein
VILCADLQDGYGPFYWACKRDLDPVVNVLLERGARLQEQEMVIYDTLNAQT